MSFEILASILYNAAFTCSLDGPISQVGKSFFRLRCVHELLSRNVETTWMLQRGCVVFCPRLVAAPVHSLKQLKYNYTFLTNLGLSTLTATNSSNLMPYCKLHEQKIDMKCELEFFFCHQLKHLLSSAMFLHI